MDRRNRASGGVVRISRKRSLTLAGAAAGAALGTIGAANAAFGSVIAQDSFNYTAGVALAGQNGGSGWGGAWGVDAAAATAWTTAGFAATNSQPGTNATDLSYATFGGTNPTGGSVTVSAETVTAGTVGTLSRAFGSPMSTTASNTLWASVEFQGKAGVKNPNFYQLTFSDTPTNGGADPIPLPANGSQHALNLLGIGASPVNVSNGGFSSAPIYSADSDGGPGVALNVAQNATAGDDLQHMFVFEIQTGVIDPSNSLPAIEVTTWWDHNSATFLSNPLGAADATQFYDLSAAEQAGTITGVQYQASNQKTTTSNRYLFMDEVNFGTTAADVGAIAPAVPEPASIAMVILGSLALVARRRKT